MTSLATLEKSLEHGITTAVKYVYPDNLSDSAIAQLTQNPNTMPDIEPLSIRFAIEALLRSLKEVGKIDVPNAIKLFKAGGIPTVQLYTPLNNIREELKTANYSALSQIEETIRVAGERSTTAVDVTKIAQARKQVKRAL